VGAVKYVRRFLEYFSKFPIFTTNDVKLFMSKSGAGKDYHKIFMHNMVISERVFQIKRGYYTLYNDPMAAGFAFSPFYYGLETALTYYDLWDYMTPISIITSKKAKPGIRNVLGRNVSVRRVSKKMFFGYSMINYENLFYIPMADIEKTLIDSVYFHTIFNKEVYKKISKNLDSEKLQKYLRHCSRIVASQVEALMAAYKRTN
jgi:predicted transcriptional regulator of viral defense system